MTIKYINHIKTPKSLTVVCRDGDNEMIRTFEHTSNEYAEGVSLIKKGKAKSLPLLFATVLPEGVKKEGDKVSFGLETLPPEIAKKANEFLKTKTDITPLKNFWERCKKNPEEGSRQCLYSFVERYGVTLLKDGRMLLYKGIKDDMTSHYDGMTKHAFGKYTEVDRSKCAFHPNQACGFGLHVAPFEYVRSYYGHGKIIEVIVDPSDVTSVPAHESKMLCCKYLPNCFADKKGLGIKKGLVTTKKKTKASAPAKEGAKYEIVPLLESITIVGRVLSKAGFSPNEKVNVWIGRDNRALVIPASLDEATAIKRYRLKPESNVQATLKGNGSLRIRARVLAKNLGVESRGSFKVSILENNAVVIRKH